MQRRAFIKRTFAMGMAGVLPTGCDWSGDPLTDVRVGICGFHGKGLHHIKDLLDKRGVRIVALCDVDQRSIDIGLKEFADEKVKPVVYRDYRQFVQDKEMDGVIIATPNHTHTLIAMRAIEAGKHAYVEKPVSHNLAEGRKLVEAARKRPQLMVTHGMQLRSDEAREEAFAWLKEGHLGPLTLSRGLNYKSRESIGKVTAPKKVASYIDYDLWSACREVKPMMRAKLHYDWHWQWDYGNGDIGNQGPHQLDVARWALDQPKLPKRVLSIGGRWGYEDDGQTPNNQLALFDYQPVPLLFDNRGLPLKDMNWKLEPVYQDIRIGNVVHCEGGWLAESRAYDAKGKSLKKFSLSGGASHMDNWLQSIRDGRAVSPHLDIEHGHVSAGLAHLANISHRLGQRMKPAEVKERLGGPALVEETLAEFEANLQANGIDVAVENAVTGPWLEFDPDTERFTGEFATEANALLDETYRPGHELPVIG
jgi:predicted dehydrogenase